MDLSASFPFAKDGMRTQVDEKKSAWVAFPHLQRRFLLPIIQRTRQLTPKFHADGSVGLEAQDPDPDVAKSVDKFVLSVVTAQAKDGRIMATLEAYGDFIKLVKNLITANYDLSDDALLPLLTMNQEQFKQFFEIIFMHCLGG